MRKSFLSLGLAAILLTGGAYADLKSYVERPDESYNWEIAETTQVSNTTVHAIRLTSQTWQGITWEHWLSVFVPESIEHPNSALILIDGGNNNDKRPPLQSQKARVLAMTADRTKSIVAMLNQVPNQPLFDGRTEDEIIAYTYMQYLAKKGDDWENWPLLFPMVKSAVRAMDTVSAVAEEKAGNTIDEFFMTGGSKRGWTTWLSAVADDRLKAIAPFVIDVLNMSPQMEHQLASYGSYSQQIDEYTELGIQNYAKSEAGQQLRSMVDPYAYRSELSLPKMIILGSNDPYWTVDASNLYFPDLKGEKHLYYQANTGHDINTGGIGTVTEFYKCMLTDEQFPEVTWKQVDEDTVKVTWNRDNGKAVLWEAHSDTRDFRDSQWTSTSLEGQGEVTVDLDTPSDGWTAYYVEVQFPGSFGLPFGSCTNVTVLPDTFPDFSGEKPKQEASATTSVD